MIRTCAVFVLLALTLALPCPVRAAAPPASRSFGGMTALLEQLNDSDVRQRRTAALTLLARGARAEAAAPALIAAFKDPDREVRIAAAGAVGKIGANALNLLGPALQDADADVRCCALDAIRHFKPGGTVAIPQVVAALADRDSQVRTFASVTLARMGEPVVPALVGSLRAPDPQARLWAGMTLFRIGEPAVKPLAGALKSKDLALRRGAARALGMHGPKAKAAVPALVGALKDLDLEVRTNAALALRRIDPAAARRAGVR